MQPDTVFAPPLIAGLEATGFRVTVDLVEQGRLRLLLWVPAGRERAVMEAGEFWVAAQVGEPAALRFRFAFLAFNAAAFEAVEVLPVRGPVQPPPGALWPLGGPQSSAGPLAPSRWRSVYESCGMVATTEVDSGTSESGQPPPPDRPGTDPDGSCPGKAR